MCWRLLLVLLSVFSSLPTCRPAICTGGYNPSSLSEALTTVTESSVTSVIFKGSNYNSANSDCTFHIAPDLKGAEYVDLVIEYLPVYQGDMYIYDSQGNSIVSASQLSTGRVPPLRITNFPIAIVWDGTSGKRKRGRVEI
jgi:hypothetical protein